MANLIRKLFDIWVRKKWIRTISKQADKVNHLIERHKRERYVLHALVKEYNKLYDDDLSVRTTEEREETP